MLIGMDQWRAVVNVAVKPRITQKRGLSWRVVEYQLLKKNSVA